MKPNSIIRFACVLVCAGVLHVSVAAATEKVLYSFKGNGSSNDGDGPFAGLINVKGTLYGTTAYGGTLGRGTVFSITTSGTEKVLYAFASGGDSGTPYARLTNVKGTLYGTGLQGGANGYGAVFSITPTGTEKVLYSFKVGNGDGAGPYANLIIVNGTLYGTTESGGAHGYGTIFSITPRGAEKVRYSFTGNADNDGLDPYAGLINVNGTLFGTTLSGGTAGYGTVFSFNPTTDIETVVYSFPYPATVGAYPKAGLINVAGVLYGTTTGGYGTVFSVNPATGVGRILHAFHNDSTDGGVPYAGLIDVKGTLYGTTSVGGANSVGTVFSITPNGTEKVLYSFKGGTDGANPYAGLLNVNGTLYGTTSTGGANGYGTVFSVTP